MNNYSKTVNIGVTPSNETKSHFSNGLVANKGILRDENRLKILFGRCNIDMIVDDNDVLSKYQQCLTLLNDKQLTHPNITKMWINYLSNKYHSNKMCEKDILDCMNAIEIMNSISDINDLQVRTLIAIFS